MLLGGREVRFIGVVHRKGKMDDLGWGWLVKRKDLCVCIRGWLVVFKFGVGWTNGLMVE